MGWWALLPHSQPSYTTTLLARERALWSLTLKLQTRADLEGHVNKFHLLETHTSQSQLPLFRAVPMPVFPPAQMSHTQSGWVSPQSPQPKHDEQDTEPTLDSHSGLLTATLWILGESTKRNARVSGPKSTHSVLSALKETGPDTIASQCSVTGSA